MSALCTGDMTWRDSYRRAIRSPAAGHGLILVAVSRPSSLPAVMSITEAPKSSVRSQRRAGDRVKVRKLSADSQRHQQPAEHRTWQLGSARLPRRIRSEKGLPVNDLFSTSIGVRYAQAQPMPTQPSACTTMPIGISDRCGPGRRPAPWWAHQPLWRSQSDRQTGPCLSTPCPTLICETTHVRSHRISCPQPAN